MSESQIKNIEKVIADIDYEIERLKYDKSCHEGILKSIKADLEIN